MGTVDSGKFAKIYQLCEDECLSAGKIRSIQEEHMFGDITNGKKAYNFLSAIKKNDENRALGLLVTNRPPSLKEIRIQAKNSDFIGLLWHLPKVRDKFLEYYGDQFNKKEITQLFNFAIKDKHHEYLIFFLERYKDSIDYNKKYTALIETIEKGDYNFFELLVCNFLLNDQYEAKVEVLNYIIERERIDMLYFLLNFDPTMLDEAKKNKQLIPELREISKRHHYSSIDISKIIDLLTQLVQVEPPQQLSQYDSYFFNAIRQGQIVEVKYIFENRRHTFNDEIKKKALQIACAKGCLELVILFLHDESIRILAHLDDNAALKSVLDNIEKYPKRAERYYEIITLLKKTPLVNKNYLIERFSQAINNDDFTMINYMLTIKKDVFSPKDLLLVFNNAARQGNSQTLKVLLEHHDAIFSDPIVGITRAFDQFKLSSKSTSLASTKKKPHWKHVFK